MNARLPTWRSTWPARLAAVNAGIRMMGAKKYKVYRVYEKALS